MLKTFHDIKKTKIYAHERIIVLRNKIFSTIKFFFVGAIILKKNFIDMLLRVTLV